MTSGIKRAYPDFASWRHANRWSQAKAAEYLGMTQSHYSKLERGVTAPQRERALEIMRLTGIPLEVVIGAL